MKKFACPNCGNILSGEPICPNCGVAIEYPDSEAQSAASSSVYETQYVNPQENYNQNAQTFSQQGGDPYQTQIDGGFAGYNDYYGSQESSYPNSPSQPGGDGQFGAQDYYQGQYPPQVNSGQNYYYPEQEQKSSGNLKWILVIVLSVIVLGVSGYIVYDSFEQKKQRQQEAAEERARLIEAQQREEMLAAAEAQRIEEEKQDSIQRVKDFNANLVKGSVFFYSREYANYKSDKEVISWLSSHGYKVTVSGKTVTEHSEYGNPYTYKYWIYSLQLKDKEGKVVSTCSVKNYEFQYWNGVVYEDEEYSPQIPWWEITFPSTAAATKFFNEVAGMRGIYKDSSTVCSIDCTYIERKGSKIVIGGGC